MEKSERHLTIQELLQEFMQFIVRDTYENASQVAQVVREAAQDDNPNRLNDILVNVHLGGIVLVFALIDGRAQPMGWPHIRLVNSETDEDLSSDLADALAEAEDVYLENLDSDLRSDEIS
jgi:hypothetical protein